MIITKVSIIVEDEGKILLLKEWSNKKSDYFWNLIKGTFGDHKNETLEDCAKREAQEEAGVKINILHLISCYATENNPLAIQFNFLAHLEDGSRASVTNKYEQKTRDEDITEIRWLTKDEVSQLSPKEFINNRIYKAIHDWMKNKKYSYETIAEWN